MRGTIRFVGRAEGLEKPLPDEYAEIVRAAQAAGVWKAERTT